MGTAGNNTATGHTEPTPGHWLVTANGAGTYCLDTQGTYVDRNIDFKVNAGSASASVSQNSAGSASIAASGFTASEAATAYHVDLTTTAGSAKVTSNVSTPGWVDSVSNGANASIAVSGNGSKVYIPTNSITGSVVNLSAPSVAISGTATKMETSSTATDYYVTVSGTGTNGSVKGKATAGTTTGIVAANATNTSGATTITPTITGSGDKVYIKPSTRKNTATSGVTYTEDTSIIIPSEGALYIEAGYTPAIKITLDQMLDGKTDTAGTAAPDIKSGKIAYNVDGKKLTGTMPESTSKVGDTAIASGGTIDAGSTITISSGYYDTDRTFTAQDASSALEKTSITGSLTIDKDTDVANATTYDSKTAGTNYITLSGTGSADSGKIYNGTASTVTKYMKVYGGSYTFSS